MKKIMSMFITLSLLVCTVGCSQTEDSDNHVVQDYFEEYEFSPFFWIYRSNKMSIFNQLSLQFIFTVTHAPPALLLAI